MEKLYKVINRLFNFKTNFETISFVDFGVVNENSCQGVLVLRITGLKVSILTSDVVDCRFNPSFGESLMGAN